MRRYLEAGKAVRTHGVRGELILYPYCDTAEMLSSFPKLWLDAGGARAMEVSAARAHRNMTLVKFKGIDTPEEARKFVGKTFFFDREDAALPPGGYFLDDLFGAEISDAESGLVYGTLFGVTSNGAQDVYHIRTPEGAVRYMPAVPEFVADVDAAGGRIRVRPIPGMLDGKTGAGRDED